jgi:hypothetical protein
MCQFRNRPLFPLVGGFDVKLHLRSKFKPMCGPVYEYSFEDFLNDASPEEWAEWESKANELELPLDYYLQEFVACAN